MSKLQEFAHRNRKFLIAGGAVLVVLLVYSLSGGDAEQEEELDLAIVTRGDIENVVPSAGSLQPLTFVDVGAGHNCDPAVAPEVFATARVSMRHLPSARWHRSPRGDHLH